MIEMMEIWSTKKVYQKSKLASVSKFKEIRAYKFHLSTDIFSHSNSLEKGKEMMISEILQIQTLKKKNMSKWQGKNLGKDM